MEIIDYDVFMNKKKVADIAYQICVNASFPVHYQDVYEHLFGRDDLILKLLLDDNKEISGFGVFENYKLAVEGNLITMLYLSGMVIDYKYQKMNLSKRIIKDAYEEFCSDFISLRTQNIAMAKSLLHLYSDNLFTSCKNLDFNSCQLLKMFEPFYNLNPNGIIENCYYTQLYPNLDEVRDNFGVELKEKDALAVIIEPKVSKRKELSVFKKKFL